MSLLLKFSKVRCYATKLSCGDDLYGCQACPRLVFSLTINVKEPLLLSNTFLKGIKVIMSYPNRFSSSVAATVKTDVRLFSLSYLRFVRVPTKVSNISISFISLSFSFNSVSIYGQHRDIRDFQIWQD